MICKVTRVSDANAICQVLVILRVGGVIVIEDLYLKLLADLSTHHPDAHNDKKVGWVVGWVG